MCVCVQVPTEAGCDRFHEPGVLGHCEPRDSSAKYWSPQEEQHMPLATKPFLRPWLFGFLSDSHLCLSEDEQRLPHHPGTFEPVVTVNLHYECLPSL